MGGGKGGGDTPDLMLPQPQSDNSDLYMAMMEQQAQQNQQMMQMIAQMMVASGQDSGSDTPIIVMPDSGAGDRATAPYQAVDFSGTRDRLHDQATQNVSDEASNRTGRSKTIISSPRLDKSSPATTGSKGQPAQNKSLLSSDDDDSK